MYRVLQGNPITAQQNLVEFYDLVEYGTLWYIAVDYGLVTILDW